MTRSERRIERLDEFFLFITSVFGLFFSLLYALLGYQEIVYGFFPLLIIGLVIPVYIGYVRGAILLDTLEERVRGWIYFLHGVVFYVTSSVLFGVNKILVIWNVEFELFSGFFLLIGGILIGVLMGGGRLYRWFCRNIFKAFNHKMTKLMGKIYQDTSSCALSISIFFYTSFIVSTSETFDLTQALMMVFLLSVGVAFFISWERDIRKWVSLVRFSDFIEIQSKIARSYIPPRVKEISFWVSTICIVLVSLLIKLLPFPVILGLLIAFLFFQILFILSTETKYTPVKKKNVPEHIEIELTKLLDHITKKKEKSKGNG